MTQGPPAHPDPDNQNQADLVLLAIQGDQEAFGALYMMHLNAIYRYIYFRIGDEHEAEDLTEEVFVRAWEALPKYRPGVLPFTSWLYRIAHNLTVDFYRKSAPVSLSEPDLQNILRASTSTEEAVEDRQMARMLAAAIKRLDTLEQEIILLRFVQGLPHQEVAAMLGKSINATRVIQHRALARLSGFLKGQDQDNG
jgi:RNA polymerase sigma-70 factor (ECF subfamily)